MKVIIVLMYMLLDMMDLRNQMRYKIIKVTVGMYSSITVETTNLYVIHLEATKP